MALLPTISRTAAGVLRNLIPQWHIRQNQHNRTFYWLLYAAANKIDEDRIKAVGPDKACAEWLVKCGSSVRFHGGQRLISDYNLLGAVAGDKSKLAEVLADEATIMSIGFPHFKNVNTVEKLTFRKCSNFDDTCMSYLVDNCGESLQTLEIISCGNVTVKGLENIANFRDLKNLSLYELPEVKHKKDAFEMLVKSLPTCSVRYEDENFLMTHDS